MDYGQKENKSLPNADLNNGGEEGTARAIEQIAPQLPPITEFLTKL